MYKYRAELSLLSMAPQIKGNIKIEGKLVGRPISDQEVVKAIKGKTKWLSFAKVSVNSTSKSSRQYFYIEIDSFRKLDIKNIETEGISSNFVSFKVWEV